jgi:riboflavin synthase alpha subunit
MMFTGIIVGRGRVESRTGGPEEIRLRIAAGLLGTAARGESIAVDGVCLTAIASGEGWFEAVVSPETLSRTTLGRLRSGAGVNLERSLRLGDRMGGHLVQGHVDAIGMVEEVRPEGSGARMRISLPPELEPLVVMKGSVAVDGVSLTVAARPEGGFEVALIPETLEVTGLGKKRPGDEVNLEVDPIGRYVIEALRSRQANRPGTGSVTREMLESHGFSVKEVVR